MQTELIEEILDRLPVAVFVKDAATGRFVFANRAYELFIGLSRRETLGKTVHDLFPREIADGYAATDRAALAGEGPSMGDVPVVTAAGEWLRVRLHQAATTAADRPRLIVGSYVEVTDEREAGERLAAARDTERERAARHVQFGEMAAGLAHEINQPLAAIIYTLTGAARRARGGMLNNAQMLEVLQAAISHGHRAAAIIERTRALSARLAPRFLPVRVNAIVDEMTAMAGYLATRAGVGLRFVPAATLPEILADRGQIEQVLLNLIRNGIEAAQAADLLRPLVVVETSLLDEGAIEVACADNGAGLETEQLARMFEPFYTTKADGMGLGLSICRTIVEAHGGHIRVGNRPEGGARVSFTLPIRERESSS